MAVAVTSAANPFGTYFRAWTFTCADADTSTSFAHGIAAGTPGFLSINLSVAFASTATPSYAVTANSTTIFFNKAATTGSGGASPGTTVVGTIYAWLPHSLIV